MDFGQIGTQFCLFAAANGWTLEAIGSLTLNIILVILGISTLIVVHEFGHFIVARMCGVRCDKFYIWFDFWGLKFFSFKWGDTEYGLGMFPLGGYVKMLGQEDNPGELRAEMERAKQQTEARQAENEDDRNLTQSPELPGDPQPTRSLEELNEQIYAPDSYLAKSVPQRLAIICAGVAMNFLFAIVCGAGAYLYGFKDTAPAVGGIVPGSPAWAAGLEVGDRITAIDGKPIRVFTDLNMAMVGGEGGIKLSINRPAEATVADATEKIEITVAPRKRETDLAPSIGVIQLATLDVLYPEKFSDEEARKNWSPVFPSVKKYYAPEALAALNKPNLRIGTVNGTPVHRYGNYLEALHRNYGKPVDVEFVTVSPDPDTNLRQPPVKVTLPAVPMKEIGVRFQPGAITMVLPGSDAEKQGIVPGDTIVSVDGDANYDPLALPQLILQKVNKNERSVELGIKKVDGTETTVAVELADELILPTFSALSMKDPLGSTALGLSWEVKPIIADSDAGKIQSGSEVVSVTFLNGDAFFSRKTSFAQKTKEGYKLLQVGKAIDIPYIFDVLLQDAQPRPLSKKEKAARTKTESVEGNKGQNSSDQRERVTPGQLLMRSKMLERIVSVRLELKTPDGTIQNVDLPIVDSEDRYQIARGLLIKPEMVEVKIDDFGEAMKLGTVKMVDYAFSVLKTLEKLFGGGVSPRALGGPVMIVEAALMFVEKGLGSYLLFLCLIGANLAVINILPFPVLDGGHVVFLLYEGITGRAPNETFQVIVSYLGLAAILTLTIWVLALDLSCIPRF